MRIVLFSKFFQVLSVPQLEAEGDFLGVEGWDLAVRKGHAVNPDNAGTALPEAAWVLGSAGQPISAVTGDFDVLLPESPNARPLLDAMNKADVRLLKLGYFQLDPVKGDYWAEVDTVRRALDGWQELSREYGVKIVYHTHSGATFMGINGAALMHLLSGYDPRCIGAYLDPGHLLVHGEPFSLALAMTRTYLAMVSVKDVRPRWQPNGDEGSVQWDWGIAGEGGVEWNEVFSLLVGAGYAGPCSVHAEFRVPNHAPGLFREMVRADVAYFKAKRDAAVAAAKGS